MRSQSIAIPVSERSQVGHARRVAGDMVLRLGLNETSVGNVAIVVTELANNLVRHGQGGHMVFRPLATKTTVGLDILAMDKGRGMRSVSHCLADGFSTAGTAGNGLGAVRRLSTAFDIYSQEGAGTVVLSRLEMDAEALPDLAKVGKAPSRVQVGAISVPQAEEDICGDAWDVLEDGRSVLVAVADGLGHGASASLASQEAMRVVHASTERSAEDILNLAHAALRSTRGAAMAIAVLDEDRCEVRFVGVGNIAALIVQSDGTSRNMVSHNGTIGHHLRKVQQFTYPWPPEAVLVMHSDGLGTQSRLDPYPGLLHRHASLIAGVLYRDFNRGRDDATVVVIKALPTATVG